MTFLRQDYGRVMLPKPNLDRMENNMNKQRKGGEGA